jgi:hypothetical protein
VRGNETDSTGRLKMGRSGFFDEVMRFYDRFLKGVAPAVQDPPIAVPNDGTWRAAQSWPPVDAKTYTSPLRPGSYTDDGCGTATNTADPTACGRSRRGYRTTRTCPAPAAWWSTWRRRARTPTS